MQRRFLSNYRFWLLLGLLLAGWSASPAYAQEEGFFALLDEDRRREFTLELGPSFMEDPVLSGFTGQTFDVVASGEEVPVGGAPPQSATKINLKTARHISGTFGWRLNDWLRVQASINFNAADFGGASSSGDPLEGALIDFVETGARSGAARAFANSRLSVLRGLDFDEDSPYHTFLTARSEYIDALDPDNCDAACARLAAEVAVANVLAGVATPLIVDQETGVQFRSTTSYGAEGTFFSISSFLSAYADIPLTSGIWLYGGGGAGVSWNHVKDGFYTRDVEASVNADSFPTLEVALVEAFEGALGQELDDLGASNLSELDSALIVGTTPLGRLVRQRANIHSTITSFAMTGAVGFRTEVFEGLVVDSGYQVIWTQKGFYRGADEKIAHLVRVGFVFNF